MLGNPIANDVQTIFQAYREQQFTGIVQLNAGLSTQPVALTKAWRICFLLGRITWIRSRTHGLRRWKRNLQLYSQALTKQIEQHPGLPKQAWNYSAMNRLLTLKKLPSNQVANVVEGVVTENLFDILQVSTLQTQSSRYRLTHTATEKSITDLPPVIINDSRAWREASQDWADWCRAGLSIYSPDDGLAIADLESLRLRTSGQMLQVIKTCCSDSRPLRDLALQFRQPHLLLAKSIRPYVDEGLVSFVQIPNLVERIDHGFPSVLFDLDSVSTAKGSTKKGSTKKEPTVNRPSTDGKMPPLMTSPSSPGSESLAVQQRHPAPNSREKNSREKTSREKSARPLEKSVDKVQRLGTQQAPSVNSPMAHATVEHARIKIEKKSKSHVSQANVPTIVYIDDSPLDSRIMATIVEKFDCRYNSIPDPIQALPMLLEIKPDLIFLDVVMPVANGYEVCTQIRRISAFKKIPIIMMTSSDGVADRVRAKLVGASGFLGKPIKASKVDKVLRKYLQRHVVIPAAAVTAGASTHPPTRQQPKQPVKHPGQYPEQPKLETQDAPAAGRSKRHRVRDFLFSR